MTVRAHLDKALNPGLIHEDEIIGHMIDCITLALVELDNSREMTEKVTITNDLPLTGRQVFSVRSIPARVVLDG